MNRGLKTIIKKTIKIMDHGKKILHKFKTNFYCRFL